MCWVYGDKEKRREARYSARQHGGVVIHIFLATYMFIGKYQLYHLIRKVVLQIWISGVLKSGHIKHESEFWICLILEM